jgi:hypothetical protein
VPRCLPKAFQPSLYLHTAAAPTLPSSDRDSSVHHVQTPAPTLASLSLAQRFYPRFAAVSSLSMPVLTAGSASGLGQRIVSASRPRSCCFMMTLHIGAADVGWLYVSVCFEPSHAPASLAPNRGGLESRATGAGVSPESLMRDIVAWWALRTGLTWLADSGGVEDRLICRCVSCPTIIRCRIVQPL